MSRIFTTRPSFKNLNIDFYIVTIDAKNVLTFENRPLVAELKFRMSQNGRCFMFSLSGHGLTFFIDPAGDE